jgi:hypothetical protein
MDQFLSQDLMGVGLLSLPRPCLHNEQTRRLLQIPAPGELMEDFDFQALNILEGLEVDIFDGPQKVLDGTEA